MDLKAIVPLPFKTRMINYFHEEHGHPGINERINLITGNNWWQKMILDIKANVKNCR